MVDDEKIFVVENCVDDQYLLTDQEIEEKLAALEDKKVLHVLWLSNFIRSKGYPFVLEMAKAEKERVDAGGQKRFHFDFAGKFFEDREKEYFGSYIKDNELDEYVTYHGIVDGDAKRKLLKECYIFALPTRYPNEGQPISILEAMGNGMFIITTDHAGIPDIVDAENGITLGFNAKVTDVFDDIQEKSNVKVLRAYNRNRKKVVTYFKQVNYLSNMKGTFNKVLFWKNESL